MNNSYLNAIILAGTASTAGIENTYVQYGFLGILLSILIWYSRSSYKENLRRELKEEDEKEKLIERNEAEKSKLIDRHTKEIESERARYHEIHKEFIKLLNQKNE